MNNNEILIFQSYFSPFGTITIGFTDISHSYFNPILVRLERFPDRNFGFSISISILF